MRCRRLLLGAAGAAGLLAAPATAVAGWKIEKILTGSTYHLTSTAKKCGSGKFGTYDLRTHGNLAGKTLDSHLTVPVLNDGQPHKFHVISVGGTFITSRPGPTRNLILSSVRNTLDQTTLKVVSLNGNRLTSELRFPMGGPVTGHQVLKQISSC